MPVLPLLLCTRPARARPSVGGQSPTPAPRQLPWSPPRGWCSCRLAYSKDSRFAISSHGCKLETRDYVLPRGPRRDAQSCSPRQTKSRAATYRRDSGSLDKTDGPEVSLVDFTSFPKPHSISSHSRPRIFYLISSSATENIRDGVLRTPAWFITRYVREKSASCRIRRS